MNRQVVKQTRLEIKDLVETNAYEFRVVAENDAGLGKYSDSTGIFVAKDPFDKPGKPGMPTVEEVRKEGVTISWTAPEGKRFINCCIFRLIYLLWTVVFIIYLSGL